MSTSYEVGPGSASRVMSHIEVPLSVLEDEALLGLSGAALRTYLLGRYLSRRALMAARHPEFESIVGFPDNVTGLRLAELLGITKQTVYTSLAALMKRGFVIKSETKYSGFGKSSYWYFPDHPLEVDKDGVPLDIRANSLLMAEVDEVFPGGRATEKWRAAISAGGAR